MLDLKQMMEKSQKHINLQHRLQRIISFEDALDIWGGMKSCPNRPFKYASGIIFPPLHPKHLKQTAKRPFARSFMRILTLLEHGHLPRCRHCKSEIILAVIEKPIFFGKANARKHYSHLAFYTEESLITIDHKIPRIKRGPNRYHNFQILCDFCNVLKSAT